VRRIASALIILMSIAFPSALCARQNDVSKLAEPRRMLLEASLLIKDIPEFQQYSATANIAGQLVRTGDLADALAIVRALKKPEEQTRGIGIIAWQVAHAGNFAQALTLIENSPDNFEREVSYETLAQLRAVSGDFATALQITYRIRNDPNRLAETLVRLASMRAKAGDSAGAREIIVEALTIAEEATHENIGHATIFPQIATTQAEIGDVSGAYNTLDRFSGIAHQANNKDEFLRWLAEAQVQIGDNAGAERTEGEIRGGNYDIALLRTAQTQAAHGLIDEATKGVARMSTSAWKNSALREIAMIQGTHGTLNEALATINLIDEPARRMETLATVALEQADNKNPEAGFTLQAATEMASEMGANTPENVLGTIAVTHGILGEFAAAERIVSGLTKPESRSWPLWNITSYLAGAGRVQEAVDLAESQDEPEAKTYALLGTSTGIMDRIAEEEKAHTGKK
jgi:tetratricopeptide (TPR) repeat protein